MKTVLIATGVGGLVLGFVLALILIENTTSGTPPVVPVDGSPSGGASLGLDLSKRYDVYVRAEDASEGVVYAGARVMGYAEVRNPSGEDLLEDWVGLELKDGRKAYVPEASLERLEEPKNPKDAQEPKPARENKGKEGIRY
jgi:hypothetical protein